MSGGSAIEESIIGEVDGFRHRNTGRRHPEHGADEFDLSLHLGQVAGGFDGGLEISHGETGEDGAVSDGGGEGGAVGEHSIGGGDQQLVVVEPNEDLPRLELVEAVVEYRHRRLEPVRLLCRVGDIRRQPHAAGVGVGDEDAVAGLGVGERRRCKEHCQRGDDGKVVATVASEEHLPNFEI